MPRIFIGGLILSLTVTLLCGCGGAHHAQAGQVNAPLTAPKAGPGPRLRTSEQPGRKTRVEADASDATQEQLARAHAHYAAAIIHEMNDETDAALEEYYLAAVNDTTNERLILEVTGRFLQKRKPEKALELLTRASEVPGASGAIYARLGLVYGQLGKTEQALAANRIAIKRSPRGLAGYQNLFVTLLQAKKSDEALKVLDDAARQTNVGPDFLAGVAELYSNYILQLPSQKAKVLPRVMAVLDRAATMKTQDAMVRLRLAETYNLLGGGPKAAEIYLELLKRLPDVPAVREQLHAKLAEIYLRGSDSTNAIEHIQALVHEDPTNPQTHYWLGYLYYRDRKADQACDQFKQAIVLSPDFAEAYYHLALAQLSANKAGESLETLEKIRTKFPQSFLLEFYSGLACGELKDYKTALRHLTSAEVMAKATEPKLLDKEFFFQLGACYERTGDYAQAEQYFQKCLEISPDWPDACNYLGYMWAERGVNLQKARELIEKAVKGEPKNAAYLDSLAWVLYKLDLAQDALKPMLEAIELTAKPDPTLFDHLGDIYSALKQPEKAREAWQRALTLERNDTIQKKLDDAARK